MHVPPLNFLVLAQTLKIYGQMYANNFQSFAVNFFFTNIEYAETRDMISNEVICTGGRVFLQTLKFCTKESACPHLPLVFPVLKVRMDEMLVHR